MFSYVYSFSLPPIPLDIPDNLLVDNSSEKTTLVISYGYTYYLTQKTITTFPVSQKNIYLTSSLSHDQISLLSSGQNICISQCRHYCLTRRFFYSGSLSSILCKIIVDSNYSIKLTCKYTDTKTGACGSIEDIVSYLDLTPSDIMKYLR